MWHRYYTLARCSVVLIISTFMTPLRFPKGSSSFVNKSMRLSAVFADLKMVLKTSKIGAAQHFRGKQREMKRKWLVNWRIEQILPFTEKGLCNPESIVKRILTRARHNSILTAYFFIKSFCKHIKQVIAALL